MNEIVILVPALNPNEKILELVKNLESENFNRIIVIDDGSNQSSNQYFNELKKDKKVKVIKHEVNMGKGIAIKTGIKECINDNSILGIVTVDADGQHLAKDARKVAEKMLETNKFILGVRKLKNNKDVPIFSRIGNFFSSIYLKKITGLYLEDTQTGLRGIPRKLFEFSLELEGERYEYEMNFLKKIKVANIDLDKVQIETIYEGRIKNFKIFKDSYIIYKSFFKNIISSTIAMLVDVGLFLFFKEFNSSVFWSNIYARILSGIVDFYLNKNWVFDNKKSKNSYKEALLYVILFIVQMFLNSALVSFLSFYFAHLVLIKVIVNFVLYFINYFVKKYFIFKGK